MGISGWTTWYKSQESIQKLKNLMMEGYEVYSFKNQLYDKDPPYFRFLEKNHGIILNEYSDTFCKMKIIDNRIVGIDHAISDDICYSYHGTLIPKI